jgi:hypothetical protein
MGKHDTSNLIGLMSFRESLRRRSQTASSASNLDARGAAPPNLWCPLCSFCRSFGERLPQIWGFGKAGKKLAFLLGSGTVFIAGAGLGTGITPRLSALGDPFKSRHIVYDHRRRGGENHNLDETAPFIFVFTVPLLISTTTKRRNGCGL